MPKIGTETYRRAGCIMHEFQVHYGKKDGWFAKVPDSLSAIAQGKDKVSGKDYNDCVIQFKKYVDSLYEAGITQEKVIIYYTAWYSEVIDTKHKINEHNIPFASTKTGDERIDYQIGFTYKVMWMINIAGKYYVSPRKLTSMSDTGSNLTYWQWSPHKYYGNSEYTNWEYLPHTDGLEQWFKSVTENLNNLIYMIGNFFGKKPEHLISNIENPDRKKLFDK